MRGPLRVAASLTSAALVALVVQPLVAAPARAGYSCGTPLASGDCTAPETTITGTPPVDQQGGTAARDATFTFESPDESASDPSTFECRLEREGTVVQEWQGCTDPVPSKAGHSTGSASYADLALGSHTFAVRAADTSDVVGGPSNTEPAPATFSWTVVPPPDTGAPETVIRAGAGRWHPFSFLGITYRGDEETSRFECTLNGRERECDDDQVNLLGMGAGDYLFTVAAVDTAGNVDPTPARERWTVPMNNTALKTHSREWEKRTGSGHFQDSYSISDDRGAFIEQAKRGFRSLALVVTTCPGCGRVAVLLRGEPLTTVDLSTGRTRKRRIVEIDSWRQPQTGKVRLEVLSQGKDVIIEGLGFSGRR